MSHRHLLPKQGFVFSIESQQHDIDDMNNNKEYNYKLFKKVFEFLKANPQSFNPNKWYSENLEELCLMSWVAIINKPFLTTYRFLKIVPIKHKGTELIEESRKALRIGEEEAQRLAYPLDGEAEGLDRKAYTIDVLKEFIAGKDNPDNCLLKIIYKYHRIYTGTLKSISGAEDTNTRNTHTEQ